MKANANSLTNPTDGAGTLRELLRVAIPLIISSSASALMYVVDRIFLSWHSVDAMAAALPASVLHWNLASLALGTVGYVNAFVAQYHGAGEDRKIGPILWQGIYLSLAASLLMLGCVPISGNLFAWFGHQLAIQDLEIRYFDIMCYGTFPLILETTLACFYSGRGRTTTIMVANVLGTLVNIVLDYLLIFGKCGFPEMGIDGAAIATSTGFASIAAVYVGAMLYSERNSQYRLFTAWRFDPRLFARLLWFGLPSGVQQFLDIACWTLFIQFIGRLGSDQLAATSLVFNLNSLVFVPLMGLGTAVMSLVGQRIGEGRIPLAVRSTWLACGVSTVYVVSICGLYLFLPNMILRPYGLAAEQPELEALVIGLLKFVAIYCWFDGLTIVFGSAIRGAGDTRFAMLLSLSLGVSLLVVPTWLAARSGPEGFWTSWYAVTGYIVVLGLGFVARFQQGRWKTMRVIEPGL